MRIHVVYYGGKSADFVVPEDILAVDFADLASKHGRIRRVEFV